MTQQTTQRKKYLVRPEVAGLVDQFTNEQIAEHLNSSNVPVHNTTATRAGGGIMLEFDTQAPNVLRLQSLLSVALVSLGSTHSGSPIP